MEKKTLAELLRAWREAEARWTSIPAHDTEPLRAAALDVVRAWLDYQEHAESHADALVLVADADGRYVAVGHASQRLLGHPPEAIIGAGISAISAPASLEVGADLWSRFLATGRQDGTYELLHRDGRAVRFVYIARAHFPVAGFHTSVLTPIAD